MQCTKHKSNSTHWADINLTENTRGHINNCIFEIMKGRHFLYSLVFSFFFFSCQETADIYLGIPLQPQLDENNYEPGLNIIGVFRPDRTDSISKSFVHVQEVAPAIGNYPEFSIDSLLIKTAEVLVVDESADTFLFAFTNYNDLFDEYQYRPAVEFQAVSGVEYTINCTYDDLPELSSTTILPEVPELASEISMSNGTVTFSIKLDSTAFMYEVYVRADEVITGYVRIVPTHEGHAKVELSVGNTEPTEILIYAYDFNLATYYATSNTSLNFNKYRRTYGNVEGGYGVFGSLNFSFHNLQSD